MNPLRDIDIERIARNLTITDEGCWEWSPRNAGGYGKVTVNRRTTTAHQWMWQLLRGEVSDELHLDHLCRNRACCNPQHLEPVTPGENVRRGFRDRGIWDRDRKCPKHGTFLVSLTKDITRYRRCKPCAAEKARERYWARKGKPVPDLLNEALDETGAPE